MGPEARDPADHNSLNTMRILEKGGNVDAIYLDFLKAFDKVDIRILLGKAKALGIIGKLG